MYFQAAALEQWVEQNLESWLEQHINDEKTCGLLKDLMQHYHTFARSLYYSPPIPPSLSVMYLTIAELWIACDKSATRRNSLMLNYDPEIGLDSFQYLCLPFHSQLRRLSEVEKYIQSRKEKAIPGAPSVFRDFGHTASFAVKYFDQSSDHQLLHKRIESDATVKRENKRKELARLIQEYKQIIQESQALECDEEEIVIDRYNRFTQTQHSRSCRKCELENSAAHLEIAVHEWPLSSIYSQAKATVFELEVPQDFSYWRDATTFLMMDVLGYDQQDFSPRAFYTVENHRNLQNAVLLQLLSEIARKRKRGGGGAHSFPQEGPPMRGCSLLRLADLSPPSSPSTWSESRWPGSTWSSTRRSA